MRICFVAHQSSLEGAGRFLLDQIDYLRGQQITAFVVVPSTGLLLNALAERGVPYSICSNPWWTKQDGRPFSWRAFLQPARDIAAKASKWRVDLLYSHTLVAPAGAIAAAILGKPHVWHLHEHFEPVAALRMGLSKRAVARFMHRTSNLVVANSNGVAQEWQHLLSRQKICTVRNWLPQNVDASASDVSPPARSKNDPLVIAMVASILPHKRQLDALRALSAVVRDGGNVRLLFVGPLTDEQYAAELRQYVDQHDLQHFVSFTDYVEAPAEIVKNAHVAVVCSGIESFGRSAIEAFQLGVPVIGANGGGTSDIIEHEVTGLLYAPGDVNTLAASIWRLHENERFRRTLGHNAVIAAEQYSSAEKEMKPLVNRLRDISCRRNPSWPWGRIAGCALPALSAMRRCLQPMRN